MAGELVLAAQPMNELPVETLHWHRAYWAMIAWAGPFFDDVYVATRAVDLLDDEITGAHWIMNAGEATLRDLDNF